MRYLLLKIFILLVGCCFFTSATETDFGGYHQTFFDEYDTYVPAEQQVLGITEKQVFLEKTGLPLYNPLITLNALSPLYRKLRCSKVNLGQLLVGERKIFLHNSSFLI